MMRSSIGVFEFDEDEVLRLKSATEERVIAADASEWYAGDGTTYTTMCVRLCDGAYFPISYSTTRERFARDEAVCASRCGMPARLFAFRNPGGSVETMTDRDGHSYTAMPTAGQFRRTISPGCTCHAAPWETASLDRHRRYALEAASRENRNEEAQEVMVMSRVTLRDDARRPSLMTASLQASKAAMRDASNPTNTNDQAPSAPSGGPAPSEILAEQFGVEAMAAYSPPIPARNPVMEALASLGEKRRANTINVSQAGPESEVAGRRARLQPIWGNGPESRSAPTGSTARDIFLRNFY
jgi:Protein of unknown function (DUF2865)